MPKEATHWILAEHAWQAMPGGLLKAEIQENKALYYLVAIVFDTPYYSLTGKNRSNLLVAAMRLHGYQASTPFNPFVLLARSSEILSEGYRPFLAGALTHAAADAVFHPPIFYFSGHGVPAPDGKQAYLLPFDGNPNYASNSAYDLEQLYSNLGAIKAKSITLFLDSCFSGANRDNEIILADARPVFLSSAPKVSASHLAVFSAASGSQISSAWSDMQHGLFSYYLMKGLKGEADGNGDNKVTQNELNDYISSQVSSQARRMGREQEPGLQSGDATRVIVQW